MNKLKKLFLTALLVVGFSQTALADGYDFAYKSISEFPTTTALPATGDYTFRFVAADNKVEKIAQPSSLLFKTGTAISAVTGTTGTTLTAIPGLTVAVVPGTYAFRVYLSGTSTANSGVKFAVANSGSTTSAVYTGAQWNGTTINARTTTTTAGGAVGGSTTVWTDASIEGQIIVSAAGNLTVQFAQNAAHVDTTTVNAGSTFLVERIN